MVPTTTVLDANLPLIVIRYRSTYYKLLYMELKLGSFNSSQEAFQDFRDQKLNRLKSAKLGPEYLMTV